MRGIIIKVPPVMCGSIVLRGIREPDLSLTDQLMVVNYKVGSMNEHLLKFNRLGSSIQMEEFKVNLAETMCHCFKIALMQGWDIPGLVDLGWEKIGQRFMDFEKTGCWMDRSVKLE